MFIGGAHVKHAGTQSPNCPTAGATILVCMNNIPVECSAEWKHAYYEIWHCSLMKPASSKRLFFS